MERGRFEALDPKLDAIAEKLGDWIESEHSADVRRLLAELSEQLDGLSVSLEMNVGVFDPDRKNTLPLLQTGLSSTDGQPAHQTWADSSPMRYVADGGMVTVPHDRCPVCWAAWDFKDLHPSCPTCAVRLGHEVKFLIDSNTCPSCEKGKVTPEKPKCDRCDFTVDPTHVAWG